MSRSNSVLLYSPNNQNNNFKQVSAEGGEFFKGKEFMGSDHVFQNNQNQQQQSSGLSRYRSAPSSFFAALLDSDNNSSSGDESEAFFASLIDGSKCSTDNQMQYSMKQEVEMEPRPGFQNGYETVVNGGAVGGSYSVGMENRNGNGNGNGNCSGLVRQSSSPAGFFNGLGVMGEAGNYSVHNHGEGSSSAGSLSSHMNLSSGPSCSSRFMPSIPENGNGFGPGNSPLRNGNGQEYEAVFPHDSCNESPFTTLKRNRDGDLKMFSNFTGLENQNGETRKRSTGLVSHMSLPTSGEMANIENLLQFGQETTVPCQVRAKRGFATHPRSIAERNRRTRISNNIKKLQDLFPDMDKQTNTAEMLDLAVDYIKDLQKQVQALTVTKAKCVCSSKP